MAGAILPARAVVRSLRRAGCASLRLQIATGIRVTGGRIALIAARAVDRSVETDAWRHTCCREAFAQVLAGVPARPAIVEIGMEVNAFAGAISTRSGAICQMPTDACSGHA